MSKTGGGKGTNQYRTKGSAKQPFGLIQNMVVGPPGNGGGLLGQVGKSNPFPVHNWDSLGIKEKESKTKEFIGAFGSQVVLDLDGDETFYEEPLYDLAGTSQAGTSENMGNPDLSFSADGGVNVSYFYDERCGDYVSVEYDLPAEAFTDTQNWMRSLPAHEQDPSKKVLDGSVVHEMR